MEIFKSSRVFQISCYRVVARYKNRNVGKGLKIGHIWARIGV